MTSGPTIIELVFCRRCQLTSDITRSSLLLRLFLKTMSGLLLTTSSLNRASERPMRPSGGPLAPSVFSETFGTCCLKTSGVILRRARRCPEPRPGPHAITHTLANNIDTSTARADIATDSQPTTIIKCANRSRRNDADSSDVDSGD